MDYLKQPGRLYIYLIGLVLFFVTLSVMLRFFDVFVYALFIYYITQPIKKRLDNRIKSPNLVIAVSLFVLVLPVILAGLYAMSVASYELNLLLSANSLLVDEYLSSGLTRLEEIYLNMQAVDLLYYLKEGSIAVYDNLILLLYHIADIIFKLIITFILSYYFLRYHTQIKKYYTETFTPSGGKTLTAYTEAVDAALQKIFFGNIITIMVTSLIGVLVFHLFNAFASPQMQIPYPLLFGILCGLGTLVPAVGIKIIWVPLFAYMGLEAYLNNLLASEWPILLGYLIVVNVFVDFTPDLLLRPLVSGKDMHKGSLMLAYIFGPAVFGFMGLFLGPIILILIIKFSKIIVPELKDG
ncbi:MAG: hypothetical protein B6U97_00840 [Candidatus Altiarchaeales archaeon ex4484_96]|nr:MAG: hypothetical protein B6U97_00840 [Candidatus Altiarchaeales archaeon ex4484_96]